MRARILVFFLIFAVFPARAQSIIDNLPPAITDSDEIQSEPVPAPKEIPQTAAPESYTVTDVGADVTADTASHARDKALLQAQRAAYGQLLTRLGLPDTSAKASDDTIALLVQSFEVQSEKLSAVRYIGVFTIRFKPSAMQKKAVGRRKRPKIKRPPAL